MKTVNAIIYLIAVSLLFHNVFAKGIGESDDRIDENGISREFAIERALLYTGFDKIIDYSILKENIIAEKRTFLDTTTLFIKDSGSERKVWSIKFVNIDIDSLIGNSSGDHPTIYEVILDFQSGVLIQITSALTRDETIGTNIALPPLKEENIGLPVDFMGYPKTIPKHTFFEVLRPDERMRPFSFSHITALYILYSYGDYSPKPYWFLILRKQPGTEIYATSDPIHRRETNKEVVSSLIIIDDETNRSKIIKINAADIKEEEHKK